MIVILGALLVVSGLAKVLALRDFRESLESWTLVPTVVRSVVSWVVPPMELALGLLAIGLPNRRGAAWAIALLLLVFSAGYATQWAFAGPPKCNCFGLLIRYPPCPRLEQPSATATLS